MNRATQPQRIAARSVPRARAVSLPSIAGRGLVQSLALFVVAALALLALDVALLRLHPQPYRVPVGNFRDKFFLEETNYQEKRQDGTTYRWTTAKTKLWLNNVGVARTTLWTLNLGGRPQAGRLALTLNDQPWTTINVAEQPRVYTLLLPPAARNEAVIGFGGDTLTIPGDSRKLGVIVEGFAVTVPRGELPLPTPAHYIAQIALLLAVQIAVWRLGAGWRGQALLLGVLVLALAWLLSSMLLLASAYLPRLAVAGLVMAALTWLLLPVAERTFAWAGSPREIRVLWALTLLCCAIRLVGVLYPTFDGQDLGRNVARLIYSITGQMIIINESSEFGGGLTIYPPGPYLAVIPGVTLSNDLQSLLEGGMALIEGSSAFVVALLARRLGGDRNAARFALLLYAGCISSFAALVFSFSAQMFGQWFTAPLALLLLASDAPPTRKTWGLALLLLLFGVYSHIGVAILGVTWFGLLLLLTLRRDPRTVLLIGGVSILAGLLALGLLYVDVTAIMLNHAAKEVAPAKAGVLLPGATGLLWRGARLAYSDVGLALLLPGLLLIWQHLRGSFRLVVPLAWLMTALLFFVVDLVLALQVRYFYFAVPLALAAISIVMGKLATRGGLGRVAAWALVLAIAFSGVAQWFDTVYGNGLISMTPLTH